MTSAPLHVRVRKEFPGANSLSFALDVTLEISPGITILFGPSGAGKSTLLDCIAGLQRPDDGQIYIGANISYDSRQHIDQPPQQRHFAYVFQSLALFPHLTVAENISYGLHELSPAQRAARVREILTAFHIEKLSARKPSEISGGEKQRVALARSLVTQPRALLLDEPLSGLDAQLKSFIIADLRAWNAERNIPILYVTHTRDEVDALGDRVIALENGRVVGSGTPREVLETPQRVSLAQAAGFENVLDATVVESRAADDVLRVRLGASSLEIEVPLAVAAVNDHVRVAIRAGDILLATERPQHLSARNIFPGKILSIQLLGATVVARIACGVEFTAHITGGAVRDLGLVESQNVWLVLKTYSCHLLAQ